jgi:histidinol-phosphate aminotransferase
MTKNFFKPYIEAIHPYEPGKPIKEVEKELGLRNVIKLASNENPLGPSGKAIRAMRRAIRDVHLYPESRSPYLIKRLSLELGLSENQIVIGNGSNEIIELVARGFLSPGDEVISSDCSFLVYPILAQACGAKYVSVPMKEEYRYDLQGILNAITERTRVIFIANPNNPTGTYVTTSEIDDFLAKVPKNVVVCFDEAYVDFVDAQDFPHMLFHIKAEKPNIIVFRTFSKAFGLAGLRVGYAVASPEMIQYIHKIRQPFNVNSIAQAAATAALDDRFFLWRTKHLVTVGRKYLYKRFEKLGLQYVPSQANFVLVNVKQDADQVFKSLLQHGMIVRSMRAYGLPTWIRVTVGRRSQNAQFYRLLRRVLS